MTQFRTIFLASASVASLSACSSLPDLPSPGFGLGQSACPTLSAGPGPFTPPFPSQCDDVITLASGVQVLELVDGDTAKGTPDQTSTVVVNYEGFLAKTGKKIDSSYDFGQSSVFKTGDVIEGWAEVLRGMSPGAEVLAYIPASKAYGSEPRGDHIPANSDLVFRVKLDGYVTAAAEAEIAAAKAQQPERPATPRPQAQPSGPDLAAWQSAFPWNPNTPGLNRLPSGVSYIVLERGKTTTRNAVRADRVLVHYEGRVAATSEYFDSSWERGEPAEFPVGGLIKGFTEVLTYMRPGDRVLVHIPNNMAYGNEARGDVIKAGDDLMFQINLLEIR